MKSENNIWVIRCAHQLGVGLDPKKNSPFSFGARKLGKKIYRYYKGSHFLGGPDTATKFNSFKEANNSFIENKFNESEECGSAWLGHVWPEEIVTLEQAYRDEKNT